MGLFLFDEGNVIPVKSSLASFLRVLSFFENLQQMDVLLQETIPCRSIFHQAIFVYVLLSTCCVNIMYFSVKSIFCMQKQSLLEM